MNPRPTHGGHRQGAGRKAGSGTGRKAVTRSVSLPPELWAKLDRMTKNRSAWIAERIKRAKEDKP